MTSTSVTDARTIVMVERLLAAGYAIQSTCDYGFIVTLSRGPESAMGTGPTFPEALYSALRDLPQVA